MNSSMRVSLLTVLAIVSGLVLPGAVAAADPPVLDQTAVIDTIDTQCTGACVFAHVNGHGLDKLWGIKPGDTFEVNKKLFQSAQFFDLPWNFWSEMQAPDLLVINKATNPLSIDNFAGGTWPPTDFLYVFGIRDLKNPGGGAPTPHAVIYLPYRLDKANKSLGDGYFLWVVHIPTPQECQQQQGLAGRFCQMLLRLSDKFASGDYSEGDLKLEVYKEFRELLDHLLDDLSLPDKEKARLQFSATINPFAAMMGAIKMLFHNGIIHGNLF